MRLSNVVENVNTASELPVTLSVETTIGTPTIDRPNYTDGSAMVVNQPYDMLLSYTTTIDIVGSYIMVQFTTPNTNTDDVDLAWCAVGDTAWAYVDLTSSDGVLTGTLGAPVSLDSVSEVSYYAILTYKASGVFNFDLLVVGELGSVSYTHLTLPTTPYV